jgi:hypothetical protein
MRDIKESIVKLTRIFRKGNGANVVETTKAKTINEKVADNLEALANDNQKMAEVQAILNPEQTKFETLKNDVAKLVTKRDALLEQRNLQKDTKAIAPIRGSVIASGNSVVRSQTTAEGIKYLEPLPTKANADAAKAPPLTPEGNYLGFVEYLKPLRDPSDHPNKKTDNN